MEKVKQTGLIVDSPADTLWIAGLETGVDYEENLPSGDWRDYEPTAERQNNPFVFDTLSCATFSFLNVLETFLKWQIKNNKLNAAQLKFLKDNKYFDENENVNFSDKYLAILSGTTKNGNTLQNVAAGASAYGLIPQSVLGFYNETTWEQWHDRSQITQAMLTLGQEFLKYFSIKYEMAFYDEEKGIPEGSLESIEKSIKQAPLHVAIPRPAHHAVELTYIEPEKSYTIFDTYDPYRKEKPWPKSGGTDIHYGMKVILGQVKLPEPTAVTTDSVNWLVFTRTLKYGMTGNDVKELQKILKSMGYFNANATGNFYNVTKTAVKKFQNAYGLIVDGIAGPKTIDKLEDVVSQKTIKAGNISESGKELIKGFEGLHDGNKLTVILEPQLDPSGTPTIGWGATFDKNGNQVTMETPGITLEEANTLFDRDIKRFEDAVNSGIEVELTQNQFDALVSFAYNVGTAAFLKSTLRKNVNAGQVTRSNFTDWCKARNPKTGELEVLQGLLKRRNVEADLYGVN